MSLLAMDTSSLFDPFEFPADMDMDLPKPQPDYREKLEIRTKRHHDPYLKDTMVARESEFKSRSIMDTKSRQLDVQPKVHMTEAPSPATAPGMSDTQSARRKLRESLTSALDMVVSKQLVKSVLGLGADAINETGAGQNPSTLEASHPAKLSQELESPKNGQVVESLVVDLGTLEAEAMNVDLMGGELSGSEPAVSVDDYRLNFEQADYGNGAYVTELPSKKLKAGFAQLDYVHRKLEIEEKEGRIAVEDVKGGLHIVDQARKLATDIEAELFKLYGSKKTYYQKARSLLFNLKDKSNPELRARVFSGEITPADLCRMSGEQLASKELSDWRNAKEQALDKMLVLTDADAASGKVVKKTHKGEFVVDVENGITVDIVPVVTRSVFPVDKVEEAEQEASVQIEGQINHLPNKSKYGSSPPLKRRRSDENDRVAEAIAEERNTTEVAHAELSETGTLLPTIMSLDEYMAAQDDGVEEDVFEDAPIEQRDSVTPSQGVEVQESPDVTRPPSTTAKVVEEGIVSSRDESPGVKRAESAPVLVKKHSDTGKTDRVGVGWTGQIQLSGNRQSPLAISHRSGEKVDLKHWPKSLELKGRVRLSHLNKFLQELQQSRSRAVTVVSIVVQEGHSDQTSAAEHVKEVASQYQMGDRVGFVEPRSGYELYLLPPGSGTADLLSVHGHPEISPEALGEDVVLVGVIVWRRSHLLSSSRVPDRHNNLKRHAVLSSTHHESISKSSPARVDPSKDPSSDTRSRSRGVTSVSSAASSMHQTLKFPVESSPTKDPSPVRKWSSATTSTAAITTSHANVPKPHRNITPTPSDATPDMPPGFSVRQLPSQSSGASRPLLDPRQPAPIPPPLHAPPGFWPRPVQAMPSPQPVREEEDDLPEFDFGVHALPSNYYTPAAAPLSEGEFRPLPVPKDQQPLGAGPGGGGHGQAVLGQPGQAQQFNPLQVGGQGTPPLPRSELPEWLPPAQFQLRPQPHNVYESEPRHLVGAHHHTHFDPAAAVGGHPPQHQAPPTLLPPPTLPHQWHQPQPQEQPRGFFQPQHNWHHTTHFQPHQPQPPQPPPPQHHMASVKSVDPRAGPFNSWEYILSPWDATGDKLHL